MNVWRKLALANEAIAQENARHSEDWRHAYNGAMMLVQNLRTELKEARDANPNGTAASRLFHASRGE